jgi:hypothetical protein
MSISQIQNRDPLNFFNIAPIKDRPGGLVMVTTTSTFPMNRLRKVAQAKKVIQLSRRPILVREYGKPGTLRILAGGGASCRGS